MRLKVLVLNGLPKKVPADITMTPLLSFAGRSLLYPPNLLIKSVGLFVLRLCVGVLLIHHGYEKLANIENFAEAFVKPLHLPFPIALSYVAAASEILGSWLLITGFMTRVGALAIAGTISIAIYHAILTSGFNIYLLELLGL